MGGPGIDTQRVLGVGTAQRNFAAALLVATSNFEDRARREHHHGDESINDGFSSDCRDKVNRIRPRNGCRFGNKAA